MLISATCSDSEVRRRKPRRQLLQVHLHVELTSKQWRLRIGFRASQMHQRYAALMYSPGKSWLLAAVFAAAPKRSVIRLRPTHYMCVSLIRPNRTQYHLQPQRPSTPFSSPASAATFTCSATQ
eukprot:GHRR01020502.1.p1 GENE.GHRR01020502.1~~GHRR01020502.1.p1  ORF type:complete len:123 (+),score=2.65 GHRR01020502.1:36-404(+)